MSAIVDILDCVMATDQCRTRRHSALQTMAYGTFFVFFVLLMHKGTDGDFSLTLTMSAAVQCLGFALLSLKVQHQQSVAGLSSRTLEMYVLFFIVRLSSTLIKNGYLPQDRSGDFIYQTSDIGSLLMVLRLLYVLHRKHKDTYQAEQDSLPIFKAIPACVLLGVFVHGDLNASPVFDTIWYISLWLDTVVMLPQLFLLTKLGGQVECMTSHFVAAMVVSRSLSFSFWYYGYTEIAPLDGGANLPGYAIILAHTLQLLLSADFMYYYFKGMASGGVVLPTLDV